MRRLIAVLLCGLLLPLGGCGRAEPEPAEVVSTVFPVYDFARELTGKAGRLLVPPGSEIHSYDPTPSDIMAIQNCRLFLYVGGESEAWVDRVLEGIDPEKTTVVRLMDFVTPLTEEITEGMTVFEREEAPDEHIWTSPVNAGKMTAAIADALCAALPQTADAVRERETAYLGKLNELDQAIRQTVESGKRRLLVFGDRFPIRYFTEEYGLSYRAAFTGCTAESEPSARTVAYLIDLVRAEDIPVVLIPELSAGRVADAICDSTGAAKRRFHSVANVSLDEWEAGESYLSLMSENLSVLKEALS